MWLQKFAVKMKIPQHTNQVQQTAVLPDSVIQTCHLIFRALSSKNVSKSYSSRLWHSNMSTTADLLEPAFQNCYLQLFFQTPAFKHVNNSRSSRTRLPKLLPTAVLPDSGIQTCQQQPIFQTLSSKQTLLPKQVNNGYTRLCHPNESTTVIQDFCHPKMLTTILTDLPSKHINNSYTRLCHPNMSTTADSAVQTCQ